MSDNDRRYGQRKVLQQRAQIICSDGSKVSVMIADISTQGMGALSDFDAQVGATLRVQVPIYFVGKAYPLDVDCVVKYSIYSGPLRKYRVGLNFKNFQGQGQALLTELLPQLPNV